MKVEIDVPDGISGDWAVETFEVSQKDADFENLRASIGTSSRSLEPGIYKKLVRYDSPTWKEVIMSNTPMEIEDHMELYDEAKGHVLINGLGLGVALKMILEKIPKCVCLSYPNINQGSNPTCSNCHGVGSYVVVNKVIIIEKSPHVIELVAPTYLHDPRVEIIEADAFEYEPPEGVAYDCVWHDIWDSICSDNLPEMRKLYKKYKDKTKWQGSWCIELCHRQRR